VLLAELDVIVDEQFEGALDAVKAVGSAAIGHIRR
jgi:hypothetical protein